LRDEDDERQRQHQSPPQGQPQAEQQQSPPRTDEGQSEKEGEEEGEGVNRLDVECLLRLGMLAFTTTTFLQIKQMPMRYVDLAGRMRRFVRRLAEREGLVEGCSPQTGRLVLWFLFVARISVLGGVEDADMLAVVVERVLVFLGLGGGGW
jgi:hypothetical protein